MHVDEALLDLQRHDTTIADVHRKRAEIPEAKAAAAAEVLHKDYQQRIEALRSDVQDVEREKNRLEGEIGTIERKAESANGKLMSGNISNPRELMSRQAEIEMLGHHKADLEDAELEKLVKLDSLRDQLEELESEFRTVDKQLEELRETRDTARERLESDAADLESKRPEVAHAIDSATLKVYERIRATGDGIGAAALIGSVCQACHMTLPAQDLHELASAAIPRCPSCEVILVATD